MIVPHNNGGCDKHGSYISQHDVLHDVINEVFKISHANLN